MGEIFFDKDPLTGKRRPSSAFWAVALAAAIILVMSVITWTAYRNRPRLIPTTLVPLATSTFTPEPTDTPTPTATWTPVPTEDPWAVKIQEKLKAIAQCPRDIDEWQWEYLVGSHAPASRMIMGPQCARDNLTRTLAWHRALLLGYDRDTITQWLGFEDYPILFAAKGTKTPFRTDLRAWMTGTDVHSEAVDIAGLREWLVYENGSPVRMIYTLKCYPAQIVIKARKRSFAELYNAPFTAQCLVWTWLLGDEVYYVLAFPDEEPFTVQIERESQGLIAHELFAYLPDKNVWVYQGFVNDKDWIKPIAGELAQAKDGILAGHRATKSYFDDDLLWPEWGIEMQPLPKEWKKRILSLEESKSLLNEWKEERHAFREQYSWPYINPLEKGNKP